jgi:hypothetical protein
MTKSECDHSNSALFNRKRRSPPSHRELLW